MTAERFAQLGPWISQFTIDGHSTGGWFDVMNDERVLRWLLRIPTPKTVMECGSLEGGHTALIAKFPGVERVLGLEARSENIAKCRLIHALLGLNNSEFVECDLETAELSQYGSFDATFCSGVLYHLVRPVEFIRKLRSRNIFIGTHYAAEQETTFEGMSGRWYAESGRADVLSGMSAQSFWITLENLEREVLDCGYRIEHIHTTVSQNGPWINLEASRR